jgi:hypothetical protein
MHTDKEARSLWCPLARVVSTITGQSVAVNRSMFKEEEEEIAAGCRCIASDCAMWRWSKEEATEGYCGLAGKGE